MSDTIQTIRRSAAHFLSGTLLSRITGMMRDVAMAYAFGTKPSVAAFMVAFRLSHLLRRVFGEGAMQSAFIPQFELFRQQSNLRAFTFFRDLSLWLVFALILTIVGISALLAGVFFGLELDHTTSEITLLTLVMMPSLLFICLYGLNASFLQCEKKYFMASAAPVAFNLIWIFAVLALRFMPSDQAMLWLSFGVVIACFCQWLFTVPQTYSSLRKILTGGFFSSWSFKETLDVRRLLKPLGLGILGVSASQINNAVDSLFALIADPEGPALLWYAIRLQQIPIGLFGVAVAGAILPPLSRAIKAGRGSDFYRFFQEALYATSYLMIPSTALLLVAGDLGVSLVYGRGDFEAESIVGTTQCLWAYSMALLPMGWILVLAPAFYSLNHYRLPAIGSVISLISNFFLNTLFIMYFGLGPISVALATSLSAWINMFFLSNKLACFLSLESVLTEGTQTKDGNIFSVELRKNVWMVSAATFLASIAALLTRFYISQMPFFGNLVLMPQGLVVKFFLFLPTILVFGVVFFLFILGVKPFFSHVSKEKNTA